MEDKDTNQRPTQPVSRPVMDVARPARPQPTSVGSDVAPPAPVADAGVQTPEPPAPDTAAEAPAENKPAFDVKAAMEEANKTPDGSAHPDAKDPHAQADHLLSAHAKKSHKPVVPIIVAVVVALALGAVTVFAYLKTKGNTKPTTNTNNTTTQQTSTTPATGEDVDAAAKEVDDATNTNDAGDIPESDLTDTNLGL